MSLMLGILLATNLVGGIKYDSPAVLVFAVFVLCLLNIIVRPILQPLLIFLSLPLVILTFGLALLVVFWFINAILFYCVGEILEGFHVASFGDAMLGALIVSVTWWLLHQLFETATENGRRR
jgi:putative membrane protein